MRHDAIALNPVPATMSRSFAGTPVRSGTVPAWRTSDVVPDVLMALGVVMSLPFIMLAVGLPIALAVQIVLWLARLL